MQLHLSPRSAPRSKCQKCHYKAGRCDPTLWSNVDGGIICDGSTSARSPARACMALASFGGSVTNCKTFCEAQQDGIVP